VSGTSARTSAGRSVKTFIRHLERVRAVRPDGELELEQELVGGRSECVVGAPVLAADLAELAWPERQEQRPAVVEQRGIVGVIGTVVAGAGEPAPRELIIPRDI